MWDDIQNTIIVLSFILSPWIALWIFSLAPRLIAGIVIFVGLLEIVLMTLVGR